MSVHREARLRLHRVIYKHIYRHTRRQSFVKPELAHTNRLAIQATRSTKPNDYTLSYLHARNLSEQPHLWVMGYLMTCQSSKQELINHESIDMPFIQLRDHSLFMPQVGTEEKCSFGLIFLLPNLVEYKNKSYPSNTELLKYATQLLKTKKLFTQPEGCLKSHLPDLWPGTSKTQSRQTDGFFVRHTS